MFKLKPCLSALTVVVLTACGGSGGGGGTLTNASIDGKVIDGYIQGAKVCLDINSNLLCDANEPSAITTAGGNFSLSYAGSIDGLRILAVVEPGPGVLDEDLGLIEKAFNLLTPAEAPTVLSPLSTMVAIEMSSKGVTAAEATATIKTALNLQAVNLLGYDFKAASVAGTDLDTLKIAQVAVSALAAVQEQLKTNSETADALTPGERFKAAVKQVQTAILPSLMKSDGTLNIDIQGKNQTQLATLVKSESNLTNVISGQIQQIVANSKAGDGTRVDFAQVFKEGLVLGEIQSGRYLDKQGVLVTGNSASYENRLVVEFLKFDIATLTEVPKRNKFVSLNFGGSDDWYRDYEPTSTKYTFDGTTWVRSTRDRIFEHKPKISGNCLLAPITADSNDGERFCAVAKDVSGQKIKNFVPEICRDDESQLIKGCDVEGVSPKNSIGYDINITATIDLYTVETYGDSWSGYAYEGSEPTIANFIAHLRKNPQWTGDAGNIRFTVSSINGKSGKMKWWENTTNCNSSTPASACFETTDFSIETIGGKEIMKVLLPNVYRKKNPGDAGVYKLYGAFPQPNKTTLGIYSGDLMPKDTVVSIPFGNVNANTQVANKTLFNAAMPFVGITKPYPFPISGTVID